MVGATCSEPTTAFALRCPRGLLSAPTPVPQMPSGTTARLHHSEGLETPEVAHPGQRQPKAQILVQQGNILPGSSQAERLTQRSVSVQGQCRER